MAPPPRRPPAGVCASATSCGTSGPSRPTTAASSSTRTRSRAPRVRRLLRARLRLLREGIRRERQPPRPQVVSEGDGLLPRHPRGRPEARGGDQRHTPPLPRRQDRGAVRRGGTRPRSLEARKEYKDENVQPRPEVTPEDLLSGVPLHLQFTQQPFISIFAVNFESAFVGSVPAT